MIGSLFSGKFALDALCRRYHIRQIALFGSTLKGANHPDSDVDLLVEFEEGHKPGFLAVGQIEAELSSLVVGGLLIYGLRRT